MSNSMINLEQKPEISIQERLNLTHSEQLSQSYKPQEQSYKPSVTSYSNFNPQTNNTDKI